MYWIVRILINVRNHYGNDNINNNKKTNNNNDDNLPFQHPPANNHHSLTPYLSPLNPSILHSDFFYSHHPPISIPFILYPHPFILQSPSLPSSTTTPSTQLPPIQSAGCVLLWSRIAEVAYEIKYGEKRDLSGWTSKANLLDVTGYRWVG